MRIPPLYLRAVPCETWAGDQLAPGHRAPGQTQSHNFKDPHAPLKILALCVATPLFPAELTTTSTTRGKAKTGEHKQLGTFLDVFPEKSGVVYDITFGAG